MIRYDNNDNDCNIKDNHNYSNNKNNNNSSFEHYANPFFNVGVCEITARPLW
jgi:hypothetical protein